MRPRVLASCQKLENKQKERKMRLFLIGCLFLGACSSYGNNPAAEFAHINYDQSYYDAMLAESCKVDEKFCTPYVVSY